MRHISFFILLLVSCFISTIPFEATAQNAEIRKFYRKHKKGKEVVKINLPGFLVRFAGAIARGSVDDPEAKSALKLLKKVKGVRVLVAENTTAIPVQAVQHLSNTVRDKRGFEDFFMLKSKDANVNFMIRERKGKIRNVLLVVAEEEELVLVSLKAKLKISDLTEVINDLIKSEKAGEIIPQA